MGVWLHEHKLGGLRWIVLNGPDREAFGALGEHGGVRSDPSPGGRGLTTLCTLVADLTARLYGVDVPAMSLELHEWDIHIV